MQSVLVMGIARSPNLSVVVDFEIRRETGPAVAAAHDLQAETQISFGRKRANGDSEVAPRGLRERPRRPQQKSDRSPLLGRKLQPSIGSTRQRLHSTPHDRHGRTTKRLIECPKRFAIAGRSHDDDLRQIDSERRRSRRKEGSLAIDDRQRSPFAGRTTGCREGECLRPASSRLSQPFDERPSPQPSFRPRFVKFGSAGNLRCRESPPLRSREQGLSKGG